MKKVFTLILLSMIAFNAIHAEVTWTLSDDGTLTISGTDMPDYINTEAPWYSQQSRIKKVIIEQGVTNIGNYAFFYFYNLTSITIPTSVTSIGNDAFCGCIGLASITIPNSVIKIGSSAFEYCSNLVSINIPNSMTSIEYNTFEACSKLTSINIPKSVISIDESAFRCCYSLTYINIEDGNMCYDSRNGCNAIIRKEDNELILGCKNTVIPNNVTSIGEGAFSDCRGLTSIVIPNNVNEIAENAFSGCYMFADNFVNNSSWEGNCGITIIDVEQEDGLLIKDNIAVGCREWTTYITIPNFVTSIGDGAFRYCSNLTSVTIPNSVKKIGDYAFWNCVHLTNVTIPNFVTDIGFGAFAYCHILPSISIPKSIEYIGEGSFLACDNLTSITVEEGNEYYDSRNNCNAIIRKEDNALIHGCKKTIIPNTVQKIDRYAFCRCYGLTSIAIPNSVTRIDYNAFSLCNDLTSIVIPNSVTTIGMMAFSNCSNLKEMTIHVNQDLALYSDFDGTGLEKLILYGETMPAETTEYLVNTHNEDFYSNTTLYVPSVLYDEYCSTSPWSKFKNIIKMPDEPIDLTDGETFTNKKQREGQAISYTRYFNNTKWQALYIPFSLKYSDWKDDFDVAYINGIRQLDRNDDGVIDETIMDVIKIKSGSTAPNIPYLIRAKSIGEYKFSVNNATLYKAEENSVDCRTTIAEYTFTGTYNTIPSATLIEKQYYAMGGGELIISDGSNDLKPYRWYMKIDSRNSSYDTYNGAKAITINVVGEEYEVTGIKELNIANDKSPIYDMNGRKVNENGLKPGIYVKNGKKVVIK